MCGELAESNCADECTSTVHVVVYCALQLYIRQFGNLGDSVITSRDSIQQSQMAILVSMWGTLNMDDVIFMIGY